MYKRNRAPRISLASLLVTFVLGAVIGGAAVYGVLGGPSGEESVTTPVVESPAPVEPEPTDTAEVQPVEEETPSAESEPEPMSEEAEVPAEPLRGARFLFISTRGTTLNSDTRSFLADFQPGGVVLLGHNIENRTQTTAYVEAIKDAAGMGTGRADLPLIAVDQEGGTVNRLRLREAPSAAEIGAASDTHFAAEIAASYAAACRARGIAVNFAPVLDIRDADGPGDFERRAFADDGGLVTVLGLAFANGLMDGGVIPVAKHYPGHGAASGDSHDGPVFLDHPVEQLAHIMYPFAEAVARDMPGIMAGHITVNELDAEAPASLSNRLLRQVLRERWGYDGVIVADDLAMRAIRDEYSLEEAAVRALQAGCDALIITETGFETLRRVATAIERALEEGILDEAQLRESQRRLGEWQAWVRTAAEEMDAVEEVADADEEMPPETAPVEVVDEIVEAEELPVDADEPVEDAEEEAPAEEAVEAEEAEETIEAAPAEPETDEVPDAVDEEPETVDEDAEVEEEATEEPDPTEGLVAIQHEVQQGEWLSRIAVQYGVSTGELVEWNNLPSDDVRYGTTLTVYLPPERAAEFTGAPAPAPAPEEDAEPGDDAAPADEADAGETADDDAGAQPAGTRAIVHDVLPGETLTRLAQRYRVGTNDIINWNDLDNTYIRVGQELTIYVPEDFELDE